MSIANKLVAVTASSVQTVSFGKSYANCSFSVRSGTGSGAVKVSIVGHSGDNYLKPSPNRIQLAAGMAPYKIENVAMSGIKLQSSGTAATATILVNAWEPLG